MIKRSIFEGLKKHSSQKEITFIIGPRQSGKTTLMLLLQDYLKNVGEETIFFNLDIERDKQFFSSQEELIHKIRLEVGDKKSYVFVDEIQRKENAGLFLKGLYDMNLPYKLIVSGSGSVELKEKTHESLVGRKRIFELNTLSFFEFVNFRTSYRYEDKLSDLFRLDYLKMKQLLREYLCFGGYPRVVLAETQEEKQRVIDEIYQSFLEKDIFYLIKQEKSVAFSHLIKLIASQIGNMVNYTELSSTLGISAKTVKDYLWYLQKTFVIHQITPYFKNIRKEITKSPVFYFYDLGLRNYSLGLFGENSQIQYSGFLFQNLVFQILKSETASSPSEIHYWRTKDGAEVDFIAEIGTETVPIEVKFKELKEPEISRSFRSFLGKYQPLKSYIVNLGLKKEVKLGRTRVLFLPFYQLALS